MKPEFLLSRHARGRCVIDFLLEGTLLVFLALLAPIGALSAAEDIQVNRSAFRVFEGLSVSANGEFAITAVGPQDDPPGSAGNPMHGGEYSVAGDFVSIINTVSNPNLPRGTRFDGSLNAFIVFPASSRFDQIIPMTIEAWVFREDTNRVETILSLNRDRSFWFGFNGPRLRFQRSPGLQADSDRPVPGRRWTQVAVAYDGSRVNFYIDGASAGSTPLGYGVVQIDESLRLGGDVAGLNFRGVLDEVRLWSLARSESEINASMFQELSPTPGLVAVFPSGGAYEGILGLPGQPGPGAMGDPFGVLQPTLQIPRTLFEVTVDGEAHLDTEYAGAEQVAIRYDDGPDAIAYLVHRDSPGDRNLYVAITGLHDVPAGRERSNSWVAIGLDSNGSRSALATTFDPQFRGYLDGARGQMYLGDGLGGFNYYDLWPSPTGDWDVDDFSQIGDLSPPTVEFRIAKYTTGTWLWEEPNGLMLGHFDVAAPSDNYVAPNGCVWNSPATWPVVTYVENSVVLPIAIVDGHVFDNDQAHPVANHRVFLKIDRTGELRATETTDASGSFSFRASVPTNWPLRLEIDVCPDCLYLRSGVYENNIQAITNYPTLVIYPAAEPGTNRYARANFYLRQPVGPIALTSYWPTSGVPRLILREEPLKRIPRDVATRVTISGENLHQQIQVYLFGCDFLDEQTGPQPLLGCLPDRDYYEARIVDRAADDSWVQVEVPHVPRSMNNNQWPNMWSWVVKDNWDRPERAGAVWTRVGGVWPDIFHLQMPPYPLVSGFEFLNEAFDPDWEDFAGVFRENAYTLGGCVRDLEYMAYFLAFKGFVLASGGICNGMSATSLQLLRMDLDAEDTALIVGDEGIAGVHFGAGFPLDRQGQYHDLPCEPYRPKNLRAHLRVNHGVQFSAEFIQAVLDQMVGGGGSIEGNPEAVLERVRNDPGGYVISMVPQIGEGHIVTPYAVVDGFRWDWATSAFVEEADHSIVCVYDCNHPEETNRFIEIRSRLDNGIYMFPRGDDITNDDSHWIGTGIYTVPISVFSDEHTMPGLEELGELIRIFAFGGADLHCTDDAGGEWGWRADGTLVDDLPGGRSMTPIGGPNSRTRSVMLLVPTTNPPPNVEINVRSNRYEFFTGAQGQLFHLERRDGMGGDLDRMALALTNGRLDTLRYTPQRRAADFSARLLQVSGMNQHTVFEWSGLTVAGGATVEFQSLPSAPGVGLRNDTGGSAQYLLTVKWADGTTTNQGTSHFGPFEVPAGASQQVFIQDWPLVNQVRSELDVDQDGTPDQVEVVSAVSPPLLPLQAVIEGNQVILSWPATAYPVTVETTRSLTDPAQWNPLVVQPQQVGPTVRVPVPADDEQSFFRLAY